MNYIEGIDDLKECLANMTDLLDAVVMMAENGDVERVRNLIATHQLSEDFAMIVNKALIAAVVKGHEDVAEVLLEDGQASVDVRDDDSWVSS